MYAVTTGLASLLCLASGVLVLRYRRPLALYLVEAYRDRRQSLGKAGWILIGGWMTSEAFVMFEVITGGILCLVVGGMLAAEAVSEAMASPQWRPIVGVHAGEPGISARRFWNIAMCVAFWALAAWTARSHGPTVRRLSRFLASLARASEKTRGICSDQGKLDLLSQRCVQAAVALQLILGAAFLVMAFR
jgi:hypothetical protein